MYLPSVSCLRVGCRHVHPRHIPSMIYRPNLSLYTRLLVAIHPPLHLLYDLENRKRYARTQRMPNVHYFLVGGEQNVLLMSSYSLDRMRSVVSIATYLFPMV
jgi:hypothetical protein